MTPLQQLQQQFAANNKRDEQQTREDLYRRGLTPGSLSNSVIQRRNGVRPQFLNSIGGDSSNYR